MMKTARGKKRPLISVRQGIVLCAGILVFAYTLVITAPLFKGASITVDPPSKSESGSTVLRGSTERVSKLTINNLEVPLSEEGAFAVERAYPLGYTVVVIRASDRFGRTTERIITFVNTKEPYGTQKETSDKKSGSRLESFESRLN